MTLHPLDISHDCHKFLDKLPSKQFKQVGNAIFSLAKNPYPNDSEHLEGYTDYRRKDIGEYRIIYTVYEEIVRIVLVGKRNDSSVYKAFKRKPK
jgi:mRNA interferase RelE/StbE